MEDAQWFIDNRGATLFNIRISKNGGILNSLKIYQKAEDAGFKCQLGAQVGETSLLSSAGRIFAALTGDLIFHEGSYGTQLLAFDLTKNPLFFEKEGIGTLDVFDKLPGIGVNVDRALLEKMTVRTFE
jgi:L-alanine-DL-glutamate epimerase-like enolase superfamily enzyme